jgi:hypothetical protein
MGRLRLLWGTDEGARQTRNGRGRRTIGYPIAAAWEKLSVLLVARRIDDILEGENFRPEPTREHFGRPDRAGGRAHLETIVVMRGSMPESASLVCGLGEG